MIPGIPSTSRLSEFLEYEMDLVIEAAGQDAVRAYAVPILDAGCSLVITSVGALCDDGLARDIEAAAAASGVRVFFPSCALAGLDRIAAAREGRLDRVSLTTRKPPAAWYGTGVEHRYDLDRLTAPVRVFQGSAREAAQRYPQSVNVAAAVGLAGVGLDQTSVEIWVDPACQHNVHQVEVEGEFGRFSFEVNNFPSENPKTGVIVAMSIMKLLKNLTAPFVMGI